jgi:hypothetical protein
MFTRIIDPFNNQNWKFPNKTIQMQFYRPKSEDGKQNKTNPPSCRRSKRAENDSGEAKENWTVDEGTKSPSTDEKEDKDLELDDFVMV